LINECETWSLTLRETQAHGLPEDGAEIESSASAGLTDRTPMKLHKQEVQDMIRVTKTRTKKCGKSCGKKCLMFCWGQPKERGHLEKPNLESINIKTDLPQIRQKGVNWIDLDQDKDNRWVFANTLMTFGIHNNHIIR
jgi:hypothetical protein